MEKEVSEAERRVKIKKTYSEKIALMVKQDIDDKELYGVIRQFFADFLKLEYEFTYEELSQELNKIFIKQGLKNKIDKMLDDFSWFEYMPDHELSQEEKKKILSDFKETISQLILDLEESPGKRSLFDKLFGKKKEDLAPQQVSVPESLQQSLPELDMGDVQQKNDEMKAELQKELLKKDDVASPFGNVLRTAGETNNLLLVTDEDISMKKRPESQKIQGPKDNQPKKSVKKMPIAEKDSNTLLEIPESISFPESLPDMPPLLIEDNAPGLVEIKGLIERSYNHLSSGDIESAKMHYMDALSVYNKFDYDNKTKTYLELYDLYKKLR